MRRSPPLLFMLFALSGLVYANEPLVFRTTAETVRLTVTLTDQWNQPLLQDFPQDYFSVYENGRPQSLTYFTHQRLPFKLVILIDVSSSMTTKLQLTVAAAKRLIQQLQPEDLVEIDSFSSHCQTIQEFTANKNLLDYALDNLVIQGDTRLYDTLYEKIKYFPREDGDEHKRKAIIILTDGEDTSSLYTQKDVLDTIKNTDVLVYTILLATSDLNQEYISTTRNSYIKFLHDLASGTGGFVYILNRLPQLSNTYDAIAEELRTQYVLGYVPNDSKHDGTIRRISIVLKNSTGIRPRYKEYYYAPKN